MIELSEDRFAELVEAAFAAIPDRARCPARQRRAVHRGRCAGRRPHLLGLYDGIPLTERDGTYAGAMPDRIFVYRNSDAGDLRHRGGRRRRGRHHRRARDRPPLRHRRRPPARAGLCLRSGAPANGSTPIGDGVQTWHSFSYGMHYDPDQIGFGPVMAINTEHVEPGARLRRPPPRRRRDRDLGARGRPAARGLDRADRRGRAPAPRSGSAPGRASSTPSATRPTTSRSCSSR